MIGVDSSIIIDILRKRINLEKLQKFSEEDLWTTETVVYELLYGIYFAGEKIVEKEQHIAAILDTFTYVLPFDRKSAAKAAHIGGNLARTGQMLDHNDTLIAGSLLAHGCTKFLTKNKRDFERIKELEVLDM